MDINENGDIDVDERELVGVGDYTVKGTEKETSDGLVTVGILRLPSLDSVGVHTEDGTYYLATVRYFNAGNIPCPLQASQEIDYLATYFMYDSLNLPRYAGLEIDELGQAFKLLALLDLIPVIRINLVERIVGVVDVNEAPLLLHPNPTNGTFSLLTTPKTQDAILELYDLKGRVLKKWDAIHDTYSIEEFSKGIYLLKMTMADEVFVGKVIKG